MVELSVLGVTLQENGNAPFLLLFPHNTKRVFSLRIDPLEAYAVSRALAESEVSEKGGPASGRKGTPLQPREGSAQDADISAGPHTHDFLLRTAHALGGRLEAVELAPPAQGAFVAEAVFRAPAGEIRVTCRPSDGIVLALGFGAALRTVESMLAHAGDLEPVISSLPEGMRGVVAARLLRLPGADALGSFLESVLGLAVKSSRDMIRDSLLEISRRTMGEDSAGDAWKERFPAGAGQRQGEPSPMGDIARKDGPGMVRIRQPAPEPGEAVGNAAREKPAVERPAAARADQGGRNVRQGDEARELEAVMRPGQTIVIPALRSDGKSPTIRISLVRQPQEGVPDALDAFLFPSSGVSTDMLGSLGLSQEDVRAVGSADSEEERWSTLLRILSPATKVPM